MKRLMFYDVIYRGNPRRIQQKKNLLGILPVFLKLPVLTDMGHQ